MRSVQTRLIGAALTIAAILIAGLAYNVVHSQQRGRASVEQEFARRATLAASLTSSTLGSSTAQFAKTFGVPRPELARSLRAAQADSAGMRVAALDRRGVPIASVPAGESVSDLARSPAVRSALAGRPAISDLRNFGDGRGNVVLMAAPIATPYGPRIAVEELPIGLIADFASAYLASAPAIRGGQGFLVDGSGTVIASSTGAAPGGPLPNHELAAAARNGRSGSYGDRFFAAATLDGTTWRVVLSAPHAALLAPVQDSKRTAWLLFAAFVAALLALVGVGVLALRRSSQLARAREREDAAQRLAHERLHDALTGLPNRALFLDRAAQALALAGRNGRAVAVLFVDLDRFKRINDSLGHASGDELLQTLAARLQATLRPGDSVSRFGGDEFLILCTDLDDGDDALAIATRVTGALALPVELDSRDVHISCCVGIAMHARGGANVDPAALVRDADAAMHSAKAQGPGSVRIFDAGLRGQALSRLDTELALRKAVGDGELCVHYQPIVALPGGEMRGVEALVRWPRPDVGLVPPMAFIPLAEECGLISELGRWVLRTAMADVARWHAGGAIGDDFALSVNVSAHQLAGGDLPAVVAALLEAWTLPPSQLWLEITETAVASDPHAAHMQIRSLSALGVRVAIDDFGVGQSSLEQLAQLLPVDLLKLDRSFTNHLHECRQRAVVAAIAPMAQALHMTAIAEGVETIAQADELSMLGYPLAQGYFFSRPLNADRMRSLLQDEAIGAGH